VSIPPSSGITNSGTVESESWSVWLYCQISQSPGITAIAQPSKPSSSPHRLMGINRRWWPHRATGHCYEGREQSYSVQLT